MIRRNAWRLALILFLFILAAMSPGRFETILGAAVGGLFLGDLLRDVVRHCVGRALRPAKRRRR